MTNHPNRPAMHRQGTIESHTYPSRNPSTWTTRDHDRIAKSRIYVTGRGDTIDAAQRSALARYYAVDGDGKIEWKN
jgi:hypothetical protein